MNRCMQIDKIFQYCLIIILFCVNYQLFSQDIFIQTNIDTTRKEIYTEVILSQIPINGKWRYQQRLPQQTTIVNSQLHGLLTDTSNHCFTVIGPNFNNIDTFKFNFITQYAPELEEILWGEVAFLYENTNKKIEKITKIPQLISLCSNNVYNNCKVENAYFVQISASINQQFIATLAKEVNLQDGDVILETKKGNFYCYKVGYFSTENEAKTKLRYYRKYVKDAFITR